MSTSDQDPISLLVITQYPERGEEVNTLLRNQGVWSRIRSIAALENLAEEDPSNWMILFWDSELEWNWSSVPEDLRQKWEDLPRLTLFEKSPDTWPGSDFISLDDPPKTRQVILQTVGFYGLKRDALQLRYAHEEDERAHHLLADTLETPIAYIQEGLHLYANPAYLAFFGLDRADSRPFLDLFPPGERPRIKQGLKKCAQTSESRPVEMEVQKQGSPPVPLLLAARPTGWRGEPAILILAQPRPVPVETLAALPPESMNPEGVLDNTDFSVRIQEHLEAALPKRSEQAIAIVRLRDLDRLLKDHGAAMIGSLLDEIERQSRPFSKPGDLVTRFGWTLCYWLERPAEGNMKLWAENLHQAVEGHLYEAFNQSLVIGITVGVSSRVRNSTLSRLIREATEASQGPEPVNRYMPTAGAVGPEDLAPLIDHLIASKSLPLVTRVVNSFTTSDPLTHFELRLSQDLLRTCHRASWPEFFQQASAQGALAVLDEYLIETALHCLLHPPQPGPFLLYLRLSGGTLGKPALATSITEHWPQKSPGRLALLFRERAIANQIRTAREWVGPLRAAGILIGLDEFGQSRSSGLILNHFKPHFVRMPATRVLEAGSKPEAADAATPAEAPAPWLPILLERKISILATDVDRAQLLNELLSRGVQLAQGPFFGEDASFTPLGTGKNG